MGKSEIKAVMMGCVVILLIVALLHVPAQKAGAETLVETSIFFRIAAAYSVDQKAAQEWLPAPWKAVSIKLTTRTL